MEKYFGIKSYADPLECRSAVIAYVKGPHTNMDMFSCVLNDNTLVIIRSIEETDTHPETGEVWTAHEYYLTSFQAGENPITARFSEMEYSDEFYKVDMDGLLQSLWAEIVGSVFRYEDLTEDEEKGRKFGMIE